MRVLVESEEIYVNVSIDYVARAMTNITPTPHKIDAAPRRE